jgi:pimeloyl-ACP methyl ester carboxylesterase
MKFHFISKKIIFILFIFLFINGIAQQNKDTQDLYFTPLIFKNNKNEEVSAELGKFKVAENRKNPNSRFISISFVRFKSTSSNPGAPIVYLAGGPGGSGIDAAKGPRFDLFMKLREFGDVIALDQRGTGLSNHFPTCKNLKFIPVETPGDFDSYFSILLQNTRSCLSISKEVNVDLNGYTIVENMLDIETLRQQLKVPKLTLWGISFGSQLALSYASNFEERVDQLLLASLESPGGNIKHPLDIESFLGKIDVELKSDSITYSKYPDFKISIHKVLKNLEANPVYVTLEQNGKTQTVGISKFDVQLVTSFILLKNINELRMMPMLFRKMEEGDYNQMAKMVLMLKSYATQMSLMGLLTDAATGIDEKRFLQIKQQSQTTALGRSTNFPFPDLGRELGLKSISAKERDLRKVDVPGLFFSGTHDGRTLLIQAEPILKKFPKVKHVVVENIGHDLFESSPEVTKVIVEYFKNFTAPSKISLPKIKYL